jgi:acyl-CoA reductase-like NAD-dependent aldehyde dehydrogenase
VSPSRTRHWIRGRDTTPRSGNYLPTLDPMNKRPWWEIADGDENDVHAAVSAAAEPFRSWRRVGPTQRANSSTK